LGILAVVLKRILQLVALAIFLLSSNKGQQLCGLCLF
jgi:hypothetical protein